MITVYGPGIYDNQTALDTLTALMEDNITLEDIADHLNRTVKDPTRYFLTSLVLAEFITYLKGTPSSPFSYPVEFDCWNLLNEPHLPVTFDKLNITEQAVRQILHSEGIKKILKNIDYGKWFATVLNLLERLKAEPVDIKNFMEQSRNRALKFLEESGGGREVFNQEV